ncbi:IMP dehydrogenase [Candidatus Ishikawella capsulata]|uniref:Inosine-5'-monophosphate dehydrogenase n=1 Tax=Candidatus Ishikawaella capsulata Mpkobe TaxID=476281 RepID=C5WC86_9ENTR|nr:IMP dehydrogenase [Candidatus Ishikawaella capsulata]BAH82942.1 inositol-5-monophosphate dehydrogenase [Candidatus Ishikawaella capsulata Mpkobe]
MLRIAKEALTFDDVLLVPAYSTVLPHMVNTQTNLTKNISLNIPIISAAMDTVTEAKLAIALAQQGGIGFIHKNMSIKKQVEEVKKVKKYESGIVTDPTTVSPLTTLREVKVLTELNGFAGYPVVNANNELVGIITKRDIGFITDLNMLVSEVMTPKELLVTVKESESRNVVIQKMHEKRVEKALIVDDNFHLVGMITVKDFYNLENTPNACKDSFGRLRVGAAVGVNNNQERIEALIEAGIDILLIDSSHGHSQGVLESIRNTRAKYPNLEIIGGNVATRKGALALLQAGVSAVKVGIGPGSICTTRIVTGVGVPQITAISDAVDALEGTDIPVIADGGIRFSGDIAKAIAAGASCVMLGSILAGTEEAPGDIELYQGRAFKSYRGMGSLSAMSTGSAERYFQLVDNTVEKLVPEGIEGRVVYKGYLKDVIHQQIGGLRSCMGLLGCSTIRDVQTKAEFVLISSAGILESHVHDVIITKESPNYRMGLHPL